jgi:hypothetical protein
LSPGAAVGADRSKHRAGNLWKEQAMSSSRNDEVARILEALASLPGGHDVDVLARRFSRCDPSGAWKPYGEWHWSVQLTGPAPEGPAIPEDADDIVLTFCGMPPARQRHSEISSRLTMLMSCGCLDRHWEFRADFGGPPHGETQCDGAAAEGGTGGGYRLTIFQNLAGGMGQD